MSKSVTKKDTRRKYSNEFKLKVVKEHIEGASLTELSKIYNIAPSTLGTWFSNMKEGVEAEIKKEEESTESVIKKWKPSVETEESDLASELLAKDEVIKKLEEEIQDLHKRIATIKEEAYKEVHTLREAILIMAKHTEE